MKTVVIGSKNPIKIAVTQEAFANCFPTETFTFITFAASSNVADQPVGQTETRLGAKNRSDACRVAHPAADYFVGLEGGIENIDNGYWVTAWMCVQDNSGVYGYGHSGAFLLPPQVSALIDEGMELAAATDRVFNETNSGYKQGSIGILTNNIVTRKDLYRNALVYALIPFLKPELYTR